MKHKKTVIMGMLFQAFLLTFTSTLKAEAKDFPSSTIHFVVPGAPGTALDITARMLAEEITKISNTPSIVMNRPGAGSQIGAEFVARSKPDGYTWLIAPFNVVGVNPHILNNAKDPFQEFSFLTTIFNAPYVLVAHPSVDASTPEEVIALAKANPGKLNYGSGGPGSANQLAAELFKNATDVDITEIPYPSAAMVMPDLLAGRLDLFFAGLGLVQSQIEAGTLKPIVMISSQRSELFPEIPTLNESGLTLSQMDTWTGILGPAGIPLHILQIMHELTTQALSNPSLKKTLAQKAIEVYTTTPEDMKKIAKEDYFRYGTILKDLNNSPR
ncbi:MAG: tripartite tricarboxylate transporter substrate binding protein [Pigmentiphaga sp.]|nr:tripartite tricarboxylate transporter substrate binding protein [Pigmentiphaga sp.]